MNKYEEYLLEKDIINFLASDGNYDWPGEKIYRKREINARKKYHKHLLFLLNEVKKTLTNNSNREYFPHKESEYSQYDIDFLKDNLESGELTIFDLTNKERILTKSNQWDYHRAYRKVFSNMNFSNKGYEIYKKRINEIGCDLTPRLAYCLYKSINKKYPCKKK